MYLIHVSTCTWDFPWVLSPLHLLPLPFGAQAASCSWLGWIPSLTQGLSQRGLGYPCVPAGLDLWFCCGGGGFQERTTPFTWATVGFPLTSSVSACLCLQTWDSEALQNRVVFVLPSWGNWIPWCYLRVPWSNTSSQGGGSPALCSEDTLKGDSDISPLLSAWSTAAPGPRTQKPTSCTARPTRPPTHYKAMPPTTTRQVRVPIPEGWGRSAPLDA